MSTHRALALLWRDWSAVRETLEPERRAELDTLVARLADEGDPVLLRDTALEIAELLLDLDDAHEIRAELREGERSADREDGAWFDLAERLAVRADPDRPTAAEIAAESAAWLLSIETVGEDQLAAPPVPGLIRLTRRDEGPRWPAFQFGPDGTPHPVVLEVNALLGAENDPGGVTSWWLTGNGWLGGIPAELIGTVPDEQLVAAAQALLREV